MNLSKNDKEVLSKKNVLIEREGSITSEPLQTVIGRLSKERDFKTSQTPIFLNPVYQREEGQWKNHSYRSEFVLSLLLNDPCGLIQLHHWTKKGTFDLVDGKQRLTTARDFINDEFSIQPDISRKIVYLFEQHFIDAVQDGQVKPSKKYKYFLENKGFTLKFQDLPQSMKSQVLTYKIPFETVRAYYIEQDNEDNREKKYVDSELAIIPYFIRINTNSVTMKERDKIMSIQGPIVHKVFELSKNQKFLKFMNLSDNNTSVSMLVQGICGALSVFNKATATTQVKEIRTKFLENYPIEDLTNPLHDKVQYSLSLLNKFYKIITSDSFYFYHNLPEDDFIPQADVTLGMTTILFFMHYAEKNQITTEVLREHLLNVYQVSLMTKTVAAGTYEKSDSRINAFQKQRLYEENKINFLQFSQCRRVVKNYDFISENLKPIFDSILQTELVVNH